MYQYRTDMYEGMLVETIPIRGHNGDTIMAYTARPLGPGPFPAVVLVHHMPGWSDWYHETTLRFARHGYLAICPNLYERSGHGAVDDVAAIVRAAGGVPDAQVVGDIQGAMAYVRALPYHNGKVGLIGSCSGGRHAYLVACLSEGVDAIVDLWGGGVIASGEELTANRPVAPIDYTNRLTAPVLGIFGNEDRSPPPDQVDRHEAVLKEQGKAYEFHRYDGAGHGFFYYDRAFYRVEQANDAWGHVWTFFDQHLG